MITVFIYVNVQGMFLKETGDFRVWVFSICLFREAALGVIQVQGLATVFETMGGGRWARR